MTTAQKAPGRAVYSIYTSPTHPPVAEHLPTLIVTPSGSPSNVLYTYLHTSYNQENYLLTPSKNGDLCIAKLFPSPAITGASPSSASSSSSNGSTHRERDKVVTCEASRALKWSIKNTGISMPTYKLTLPSVDPKDGTEDQPLFQVSKTNRSSPFWTMWYYTYSGHLVPPTRVEFGKIEKASNDKGGGTRVVISGTTDEEQAVWQTLGPGNADMVEWIVLCAALNVLDDEIRQAARDAGQALRPPPSSPAPGNPLPSSRSFPKPTSTVSDGPRSTPKRSLENAMQGVSLRDPGAPLPQQQRPPSDSRLHERLPRERTISNPDPRKAVKKTASLPQNLPQQEQQPLPPQAGPSSPYPAHAGFSLPQAQLPSNPRPHNMPPPPMPPDQFQQRPPRELQPPPNGPPHSMPLRGPSPVGPNGYSSSPRPQAPPQSAGYIAANGYRPMPQPQEMMPPANSRPGAFAAQGGPLPHRAMGPRQPEPRSRSPMPGPAPQQLPPQQFPPDPRFQGNMSQGRAPIDPNSNYMRQGARRPSHTPPPQVAGQLNFAKPQAFADPQFYQLPPSSPRRPHHQQQP